MSTSSRRRSRLRAANARRRSGLSLARQARDAGMVELTLTGGEPFVRP